MADIRFQIENADGPEDDQEDEGCEMDALDQDESSILYHGSIDEPLTALSRMERFMLSDIIVNRQMAARCCQDALRVSTTREEVYHVLRLMVRLSDDIEPSVRVELMEQVPHVAVYCYEHYSMMEAVPRYILYIVLRFLTDSNNQVRKTSQAALLVLLEQEVVEREDVEEQVCPVLLQLTAGDSSDDYRSEAIALMSKMAPLVGKDITERYFLPRFETLCSDPLFHVRKVCASNFGEICNVVGPEVTRERMLPVFFKLCQDGVWGVRKACAECYMSVSTSSPTEIRKNELSQCFISLLCDKSRWVQMAAYQSLGPFISTFADPAESGFYVNEDGVLCQVEQKEPDAPSSPTQTEAETTASQSAGTDPGCESGATTDTSHEEPSNQTERQPSPEARTTDSGYISPPEIMPSESELHKQNSDLKSVPDQRCSSEGGNYKNCQTTDLDADGDNYFNSFLYWRAPLPQVELDLEGFSFTEDGHFDTTKQGSSALDNSKVKENIAQVSGSHQPRLAFVHGDDDSDEEDNIHLYSLTDDFPSHEHHSIGGFNYDDYRNLRLTHSSSFEEDLLIADHISAPPVQHVIPQTLLDHYVSMTEPAKAQTIDTEIVRHCAFSLPAVALTLGRKNWPCLRDTYELLTSDMQWKVRRTLAFSIHELALVLGREITRMELLPTFNSFLKDLDEVRIGVLKHLADFIKLLPPDVCTDYLPMLTDFLTTDNNRNWRFRFELAEQLMLLSELYKPIQVLQFICPIAISLATDRVADVRTIAFKLIGVLLQRLHSCPDDGPAHKFVCDIINKFAHSPQWTRRQAYAQLCQSLMDERAETGEQFCQEFLPSLLYLLSDPVPNVRLSLSRTLAQSVSTSDYFMGTDCEAREAVLSALQRLKGDQDRDVRYFAGVEEDALDSNYESNAAASGTSEEHAQGACCSALPEQESNGSLNLETTPQNENIEHNDTKSENREETEEDKEESLEGTSGDDQLESTVLDFEENERRLDRESEDLNTRQEEVAPLVVEEDIPDYSEA